jgi:hypothetical protein
VCAAGFLADDGLDLVSASVVLHVPRCLLETARSKPSGVETFEYFHVGGFLHRVALSVDDADAHRVVARIEAVDALLIERYRLEVWCHPLDGSTSRKEPVLHAPVDENLKAIDGETTVLLGNRRAVLPCDLVEDGAATGALACLVLRYNKNGEDSFGNVRSHRYGEYWVYNVWRFAEHVLSGQPAFPHILGVFRPDPLDAESDSDGDRGPE